jgi:hypothetical protein
MIIRTVARIGIKGLPGMALKAEEEIIEMIRGWRIRRRWVVKPIFTVIPGSIGDIGIIKCP